MKIILPAMPFAARWYAQTLTCPHCAAAFQIEEKDILTTHPYGNIMLGEFLLDARGIQGWCPACEAEFSQEKATLPRVTVVQE